MKKILFLCTGNYYRSRFSEYLFNYLASKKGIKWQADSRGLNVNPQSGNVGSISLEVIKALEGLDIQLDSVSLREPMQVKQTDLENATQIIAVDEVAHRPLMQSKFPEWVDKIEPMDPGSMELFMLERSDHFDENRSRLCCQMDIYDVYEGLTVHLVDNSQDK